VGEEVKIDYTSVIILAFLPLALRTLLYLAALRVRSIHIPLINCMVVAGAPYLVAFLPLPFPEFVRELGAIVLAIFLLNRYTEAELYPDGIVIPVAVELLSRVLLEVILLPLLTP
jgi:hypothetical protein